MCLWGSGAKTLAQPTELDGVQIVPKCRPNERPEQCPRMNSGRNDVGQQSLKRLGLYTSEHRILVVGDGDFSFSRHLAQALFPKESERYSLPCPSHSYLILVAGIADICWQLHFRVGKKFGQYIPQRSTTSRKYNEKTTL